MNRKQLLKKYQQLQGPLQKKSSSIFLGFQKKIWKISENGTKISYKNQSDEQSDPNKIFMIQSVDTEELQDQKAFLLHTPNRVFELRADSQQHRKTWMRAILALKKQIKKKHQIVIQQKKPIQFVNDSTMATLSPVAPPVKNVKQSSKSKTPQKQDLNVSKNLTNQQISLQASRSTLDLQSDKIFGELLKKIPPSYAQFNVYIVKLKTSLKDMLFTSARFYHFIFFSSKSLFPEQFIGDQNLNASQLPHWAEIDVFYRVGADKNGKMLFRLQDILETKEEEDICSLHVKTKEDTFEFVCNSLQQRKKLSAVLQKGKQNAMETRTKGIYFKKNYDNLIWLQKNNVQEFNFKVSQIITPLTPAQHKFELQVVSKFIQNLSPFMEELIVILQNKVKKCPGVIIDAMRMVHQEVRIHLKIAWDTSNGNAKAGQILDIIKAIAYFQNLISPYIQDKELLDALKQLSKIYMRACFKNFQTIILGIVEFQKKDDVCILQDQQECQYVATHAITDLFKFIYEVFDITMASWHHNMHLHNSHRLIKKALSVFVSELKSMVDEQELATIKLVGIANNYIRFGQQIDNFYLQKLSSLKQQTRDSYQQLKNEYRQVSMIIIQKLVLPLKIQFKIFFEKQTFFSFSMEQLYKLILNWGLYKSLDKVHFLFSKRFFQKIFTAVRQGVCKALQKEAKKPHKKKPEIKKILQRIEVVIKVSIEMNQLLSQHKLKIDKDYWQLKTILVTNDKEQLNTVLNQTSQQFKKIYKQIIFLRADYQPQSPLHKYINNQQNNYLFDRDNLLTVDNTKKRRKSSLSKYYMQQVDRNSVQSIQKVEVSSQQKLKMISSGQVRRKKNKSTVYEWIFLKLKQSVLYIYENDAMQRCQNTIKIEDIHQLRVPSPEKASFVIIFETLNRLKQMKIRCDSLDQKNRWVFSIQLEMKRLSNDRKMRTKGLKIKKDNNKKLVIDYEQLNNGPDYFSYST